MLNKKINGAIIPISIKRCPELTVYEKFILEYLLQEDDYYYNQKGFYHSCVQFAEELHISKNTICTNLKNLEEKGFISTKKQKGRNATEFIINYDRIAELSKYSPAKKEKQEKVVTLQPDNQEVKEKLIVEEKPIKVKDNLVKVEEPKTEPVTEEQPSTDTIPQTEEKQPKIRVNPFAGQSPKTFPSYPFHMYYPEDKDRMNEVYLFLDARANVAEQYGFTQTKAEDISDGIKNDIRQLIKPKYEDTSKNYDCVNDLRQVKLYYDVCEKNPKLLRVFADIFLELGNENVKIGRGRHISMYDKERMMANN